MKKPDTFAKFDIDFLFLWPSASDNSNSAFTGLCVSDVIPTNSDQDVGRHPHFLFLT